MLKVHFCKTKIRLKKNNLQRHDKGWLKLNWSVLYFLSLQLKYQFEKVRDKKKVDRKLGIDRKK